MSSLGDLCTSDPTLSLSVPWSLSLSSFFFSFPKRAYSEVPVKRGQNQKKSVQWLSSLRLQGKLKLFTECAPALEAQCRARSPEMLAQHCRLPRLSPCAGLCCSWLLLSLACFYLLPRETLKQEEMNRGSLRGEKKRSLQSSSCLIWSPHHAGCCVCAEHATVLWFAGLRLAGGPAGQMAGRCSPSGARTCFLFCHFSIYCVFLKWWLRVSKTRITSLPLVCVPRKDC